MKRIAIEIREKDFTTGSTESTEGRILDPVDRGQNSVSSVPLWFIIRGLGLMLSLAACGGGGDGGDPASASDIGTLAYVETECRGTAEGFVERQALRIRQGDREPVTVFETPAVSLPGQGYLCDFFMLGRYGGISVTREAFQAVAVSPDGASVVFDVTDEFSVRPPLPLNLPPGQKGIFWVRADGTGLRPLGPPSRQRLFDFPSGGTVDYSSGVALSFSSDGRTIAFVDKVPGVDGHETNQVVTVDVATGTRTQVTHLPPAVPPAGFSADAPTVFGPRFVDSRTISFYASANPDGLNPEGIYLLMTTRTDGSGLEVPLPVPVALPGGTIDLRFVITGDRPQATLALVPGHPTNDPLIGGARQEVGEVFVIDEGKNILQLTNLRRQDTYDVLLDVDREHVYFTASADPLGTNPSYNCQMFSIDRLGAICVSSPTSARSNTPSWAVHPRGWGSGVLLEDLFGKIRAAGPWSSIPIATHSARTRTADRSSPCSRTGVDCAS